jgi:hypothetical protein
MEVDLSNYRTTRKRKHGRIAGVGGHCNASCDASSHKGPADMGSTAFHRKVYLWYECHKSCVLQSLD